MTVTAADPSGLSATVAVADGIPAQCLIDGAPPEEVAVLAYFTDPDGDALTFRGAGRGEAAVTVTASDPDSLEARAVFTVEVTENPDRAALVALYEATRSETTARTSFLGPLSDGIIGNHPTSSQEWRTT